MTYLTANCYYLSLNMFFPATTGSVLPVEVFHQV